MELVKSAKDIFYSECDIVVRRSEVDDAEKLAFKLSEHDKLEAWLIGHNTPLEALKYAYDSSIISMTIEHSGSVVGMLGIIPDEVLGQKACIWFLASDELKDIGRVFLRNAKKIIGGLLEYYPFLYGNIHVENKTSMFWMQYCGCRIEKARPYGVEGSMFHPFSFERIHAST